MKGISIQANFGFRLGENLPEEFEKVYTSQVNLRKLFMPGSKTEPGLRKEQVRVMTLVGWIGYGWRC